MPLTITEHMKHVKDDMEVGVVKSWLEHYPWLDMFEVKTIPGLKTTWRREETLGTVGKRSINETFIESHGTTSTHSVTLELVGGLFDIDKELLDDPTYEDEAARQISMKARAVAFTVADDIVNGNPGSDIEEFAGLKVVSGELPSRMTVDAGGLDLTTGAQREANADEAIRYLMLGIQRIRSGTGRYPSFCLMGEELEQFIVDAMRRAGHFKVTDDTFTRRLATGDPWNFAGVPVYCAGFQQDQATQIIGTDHDGTGYTSAYFVYTSPMHTRLLQKYTPRTEKIGKLENGTHVRWLHEHAVGLQTRDKFSVCRVKGFDVTA